MTTITCYDLKPGGPFHLGRRGVEIEETGTTVPADTLFAALFAALYEFGFPDAALAALADTFPRRGKPAEAGSAPFLLSSAFPRAGGVRFYPALPLNRLNLSAASLEDRLKALKQIGFLSQAIFERAVAYQPLDDYLPRPGGYQDGDRGLFLQGTDLWLTAEEVATLPDALRLDNETKRPLPPSALAHLQLWESAKVPRVTVDRIDNRSSIFHAGRLTFNEGCGFWFGIAWRQPDLVIDGAGMTVGQLVERGLAVLADIGLGGERAVGYGHFTYDSGPELTWPDPTPGRPFVTLSRYHPRPDELPQTLRHRQTAYKLESVGGWLQSPERKAQRRRRLWLLSEGSIVGAVGDGPWGDVTDVRPVYDADFAEPAVGGLPHPVWRYGLACPIPYGGAS